MIGRDEIDLYEERENFYNSKDTGSSKKTVNPWGVASVILRHYRIITLLDTNEMFYYDDGIYRPNARSVIKGFCERALEDEITCHTVNEIIAHIERCTYFDRTAVLDGTADVNLMNGIVNVLTGQWRDHSPDEVFFTQLPFAYDPDAACPAIDDFILEVFPEKDRDLAYEMVAYTLVPSYPIQKALALVGSGNNGKSTFLGLIKRFLGPDNVSSIMLQNLDNDRFACAQLYGKRANLCADLPSSELHQTTMFKSLTGGDRVTAQFKHVTPFQFENCAKLFFSMNQVPLVEDESDAFFRRWILIDFPNKFEGEKLNLNKIQEISTPTELKGLFNRCLKIIPELLKRKTFCSAGSTEATREKYIRMSDSVYCFIEDQLEVVPEASIRKKDLYNNYLDWCREHRTTFVKERKFKTRLTGNLPSVAEGRQFDDENHKVHVWQGIRFKNQQEIEDDRKAGQARIGDY
jgi:putative DNA primase/helicase